MHDKPKDFKDFSGEHIKSYLNTKDDCVYFETIHDKKTIMIVDSSSYVFFNFDGISQKKHNVGYLKTKYDDKYNPIGFSFIQFKNDKEKVNPLSSNGMYEAEREIFNILKYQHLQENLNNQEPIDKPKNKIFF